MYAPLVFTYADELRELEMFKIYRIGQHYSIKARYNDRWLLCWYDWKYGNCELGAFSFGESMDGDLVLFDFFDSNGNAIEV